MPTIKQQICARIKTLLDPLVTENKVRLVARKRSLFLLEDVRPAIHIVIGPETVLAEEESHRGYEMEFDCFIKIIAGKQRDPEDYCDELAGEVQKKIEADLQLNSLASWIKYTGDLPFTFEELKPEGGIVVNYVIRYRRYNADPNKTF